MEGDPRYSKDERSENGRFRQELESLEKLRRKLLDLTTRNRLLNYKEGLRSIRVSNESPDGVFQLLVSEGKSMELVPLTDHEGPGGEKPDQAQLILLPDPLGESKKPHKLSHLHLRTQLAPDLLERRCKRILHESRTAIEESGSNLFHLAIGFLEWFDDINSAEVRRAPLILIPVRIERGRLNKRTNCYSYIVSYTDEDIETNLSLAVKLDQDFNLILSELDEEVIPETYLKEVGHTIDHLPRWRVVPDMVFGMFAFAKIVMYKDLDHSKWPKGRKIVSHKNCSKILVGGDNGDASDKLFFEEEHAIDRDKWASSTPLVSDADSSQHSAIIDVLCKEKDLAIEGPPGTGKSQTITNLIAAALNEGKSILFVAEKKAALDVVRRRLDQVELGDFCLELHSHKTQKGQLHKDIAQRLARKYEDAEGLLSLEIEDLSREREKALQFSHIANKRVGPNGERIYELPWILENLRGKIHDVPIQFSIANASRLTREQISVCIEKLEDAARLRGELPDSIIATWQGFRPKGIMPGDAEKIRSGLMSLETEFGRLSAHIDENRNLIETAGIDMTMGLLRTLTSVNMIMLDSKPAEFDEKAGITFLEAKNLDLLQRLDESIKKYLQLMREAQPIAQALSALPAQRANELVCVTDALIKAGYGDKNLPALKDIWDKLGSVLECIHLIQGDIAPVVDCYHEPPSRLNEILRVLKMYTLMKKSPKDLEIHIHAGHALEIAESLYGTALQECTLLSGDYRELCQVFEHRVLPKHEEITNIALTLRKHRNSPLAFLSGEYRQAKRSVKIFLVNKKFFRSVQLPGLLERMADTIRRIQAVKIHEDYSRVLGPLYHGIETDWNRLYSLVSWAQEFRNTVESQGLALSLMQNLNDVRERLMRVSPKLQKNYEYLLDKAGEIGLALDHDSDLRQEADKISNLRTAIERALGVVPNNELFGGLDVAVINASIRAYLSALDLCDKIAEDNNLKQLLGSRFKGVETDLKTLLSVAEWVQDLVEKSGLPKKIVKWLIESRIDAKMSLLKGLLAINREIILRLDEARRELTTFGSIDVGDFFGDDNSPCQAVGDNVSAYIDAAQYLVTLSDYHRCVDEADQLGLKRLTDRIYSKQLDFEECAPLYKYIVYGSIAREVINEHGELAGFTRTGHENAVNRFAALDKQLMKKMAKHIAYKLYQGPVPSGIGTGPVRDYTDRCLLVHEIHKKKKHIPIRQLVRRAGTALKALKPCFMMSPLSVAQYLEPGKIEFDLVVMDEASQIRPADAIGAIARANQLVIVGDPHQLPPTSFFERLGGDEYAEDAYAVTDTESILDVCMAIYPKRRLRWHYRSRHESLIAFSNNRFYDDDLIVFPTNQKDQSVHGVKHHYIEGATYLKGRNRDEATAVVLAIINHVRSCPGESLGVATFNREQSELILDILERFQKNDQWLEEKLKESENSNEPFFIKNLENVQGDERDVIFISTTYGPDPTAGQVYQRFGPITEEVGWRRLNVIITRAKKRVEVFTSMRSTDIRPTESSSRGVRALKEYLEYAEKGILTDPGITGTGKEPGSDFELSVGRILKTHGYQVVPQVGVAGFFIDIGVRHPYREREFIVGIECDGATYHSAKSVRDRDRLRQEILESKGWKIHRIWSVDWFKNREKEIKRLLNAISEILKEEPEVTVVKEVAEVKKPAHGRDEHQESAGETAPARKLEDRLREELALYNATNIQPRFPGIKNGILRDEMLELFVKRMPTTKDEFYQSIPQNLRTNTYGKQMQFLEDILDIIEGYAD